MVWDENGSELQEYELIKHPWHQSADLRALTFLLGLKIVSLNSSEIQLKMHPNQNVEENKPASE